MNSTFLTKLDKVVCFQYVGLHLQVSNLNNEQNRFFEEKKEIVLKKNFTNAHEINFIAFGFFSIIKSPGDVRVAQHLHGSRVNNGRG